jgi:uncharacterized protein YjaG (DUF416 family)
MAHASLLEDLKTLADLDVIKQRIFAYITCERLYPNYVYFSKNFNFGDTYSLDNANAFIYKHIFSQEIDVSLIRSFIKQVDNIIPEPAHFDTILASSALDACTTTIEALEFLLDGDALRLDYISTFATDTTDMYVSEIQDLDINVDRENYQLKVDSHTIMITEIEVQKGIISYLSKIRGSAGQIDIDTLIALQGKGKGSLNLK